MNDKQTNKKEEREFIDWLFNQYDNPKEAVIVYASKPFVLDLLRKKYNKIKNYGRKQ